MVRGVILIVTTFLNKRNQRSYCQKLGDKPNGMSNKKKG
jgi:hypothetical protein